MITIYAVLLCTAVNCHMIADHAHRTGRPIASADECEAERQWWLKRSPGSDMRCAERQEPSWTIISPR